MILASSQPFPKLSTKFINADGTIGFAWYRLLITLWQRTGNSQGSQQTPQNAVYLTYTVAGIGAYLVSDNTFLGYLGATGGGGGPALPQTPTTSPFVFTAAGAGTILASSGMVELSRNGGGTYYTVGLQGGTVPVQIGDKVRVSWTVLAPTIVFFPTNA